MILFNIPLFAVVWLLVWTGLQYLIFSLCANRLLGQSSWKKSALHVLLLALSTFVLGFALPQELLYICLIANPLSVLLIKWLFKCSWLRALGLYALQSGVSLLVVAAGALLLLWAFGGMFG